MQPGVKGASQTGDHTGKAHRRGRGAGGVVHGKLIGRNPTTKGLGGPVRSFIFSIMHSEEH